MSTQKKSAQSNRSRQAAETLKKLGTSRIVVLDQVGFVKHRRGHGVLRLKLVGPVDSLRRLRLEEGERLAIVPHHLIGERAA